MGPRTLLFGILTVVLVHQTACRQVEVRASDASVEGTAKGELLVRFTLDQDVDHLGNPDIFGYLRVRGQAPTEGWNAAAVLQEAGRAGEGIRYLCQFPLKADRAGDYSYDGIGGKRIQTAVDAPYNLEPSGEYELEFRVSGAGFGAASVRVVGATLTLVYRRP